MSWNKPSAQDLYDVIDATWAPYSKQEKDGWFIREGRGGGKRVSAANQQHVSADIEAAETAMALLKQPALFMIRDGFPTLEMQLAKRGYSITAPTIMMAKSLSDKGIDIAADFLDTPSPEQMSLWEKGGIDARRLDVMHRVDVPKTFVQIDGATGFAAVHNNIVMVHAVEVSDPIRRQGVGQNLMNAAAMWGSMKGAHTISIVTTRDNRPAQNLYKKLGYSAAGTYHYRIKR